MSQQGTPAQASNAWRGERRTGQARSRGARWERGGSKAGEQGQRETRTGREDEPCAQGQSASKGSTWEGGTEGERDAEGQERGRRQAGQGESKRR
eukprot:6478046-Alexandrium_andersonii.AAC.1